jgi:hypothetical protein
MLDSGRASEESPTEGINQGLNFQLRYLDEEVKKVRQLLFMVATFSSFLKIVLTSTDAAPSSSTSQRTLSS